MTPEERERTIEFIIRSQARLVAAQEQDREGRLEFEGWAKKILANMSEDRQRLNELLQIQSRRLDESEARLERAEREDREAQQRHKELLQEIRIEIRAGFERLLKLYKPGQN